MACDPWLVYIALPTTGTPWLALATEAAGQLMRLGGERGLVVVPLTPAVWEVADILYPRCAEAVRDTRRALIERCDAFLRLPGLCSEAAADEEWALENGLPVFDAEFEFLDYACTVEGLP